jgi:hypothetical protein
MIGRSKVSAQREQSFDVDFRQKADPSGEVAAEKRGPTEPGLRRAACDLRGGVGGLRLRHKGTVDLGGLQFDQISQAYSSKKVREYAIAWTIGDAHHLRVCRHNATDSVAPKNPV